MQSKNANLALALKLLFTFLTWGSLIGVTIALGEVMGGNIIPVLFLLGGMLVVLNGFIWDWGQGLKQSQGQSMQGQLAEEEKRKRDMLDSVLRNMSDEQLRALRTRLNDPDFEDDLRVMLGDDGELITGQR